MSSSTCKQNHTRAEIDTNKAITASKKAEKAQKATQKLEAQRQKWSAKESRTVWNSNGAGRWQVRILEQCDQNKKR
ncbi:uncharacterized protein PGTG_16286 [Puccinia graminis f. sp. tritici CRL 75-36-700-3]|uniref:Uncharacterized protein n=1 Tax=Puccinia graminis f. sp. tritici (strain CRL 75-36-700-3 / race SCCL) TaxID=418459 RepID=E3L0B1_PUCGT|nr:uncharacterized protein PGTG_16286 [Puccinia graminis f. sp. tritici CRL 75-36-700-3]EFP89998.2 hypothetical protein PGTG_16286 [Puccinia graminis f. sp. tritici CRL 75-36-700-3]